MKGLKNKWKGIKEIIFLSNTIQTISFAITDDSVTITDLSEQMPLTIILTKLL